MGGFDGHTRLKTSEYLDTRNPSKGWRYMAEMITPRSNFSVVIVDNMVLVMGGFDGNVQAVTDQTEAYSTLTNTWEPYPQIVWPMSAMKAVTTKGLFSYL